MKPFDVKATCEKCGHDTISSHYAPADHRWDNKTCRTIPHEHIRRTCQRCRFWWDEKPIDSPRGENWARLAKELAQMIDDAEHYSASDMQHLAKRILSLTKEPA